MEHARPTSNGSFVTGTNLKQIPTLVIDQNKMNTNNLHILMVLASRLAWGIASLRQTTDFTPGFIAERSCREVMLDLAGMMPSPTQ
jgi:hypothetical protein